MVYRVWIVCNLVFKSIHNISTCSTSIMCRSCMGIFNIFLTRCKYLVIILRVWIVCNLVHAVLVECVGLACVCIL